MNELIYETQKMSRPTLYLSYEAYAQYKTGIWEFNELLAMAILSYDTSLGFARFEL